MFLPRATGGSVRISIISTGGTSPCHTTWPEIDPVDAASNAEGADTWRGGADSGAASLHPSASKHAATWKIVPRMSQRPQASDGAPRGIGFQSCLALTGLESYPTVPGLPTDCHPWPCLDVLHFERPWQDGMLFAWQSGALR